MSSQNSTTRIHLNFTTSPTSCLWMHLPPAVAAFKHPDRKAICIQVQSQMTPQIFAPKSNCEDTVVVAVHLQSTSRKMVHYIGQTVHFLFSVSGFLKLISQPARHRRRFAPIISVPTLLHLFCRPQSEASTQHAPDATHYFASSASSDVSAKLFSNESQIITRQDPRGMKAYQA